MSPSTIYLIHHSHCDLGYTHDLPIVYELHRRFIDEALDLTDLYADLGEEATFRWTCEVTSVVEHWMKTATPRQLERFVAAARRGQIEVCALWCNLTPLATLGQHLEMLAPLRRLRDELGLTVRAAMNSDVNGFSWALAGLLAEAGIQGLTMSVNEHFGGAPRPFPGLFRWRLPQGGLLPVWNGPTYAHTAWLGLGGAPEAAFQKISAMIARRQETGPSLPWLAMQITHPGPQNDNMGPLRHLSPWVRRFNDLFGDRVRLVIATPGRLFDLIADDTSGAEIREGEWNDWWNFGCGSTPFETALFRRATARLEEADLLSLVEIPKNFGCLRARAHAAAAHYIEHTWGADLSVHQPEADDARIQSRHKEQFAYDAFSLARLLRRDGLGSLAARIDASPGPALMVFNPSPHPRHEVVRVPRRFIAAENLPPTGEETALPAPARWPRDQAYQHFVDREFFGGTALEEIGPFRLPGYSWTVVRPGQAAAPAENLHLDGSTAGNGRVTLKWKPDRIGLSSLSALGREWAEGSFFGAVVAEEVLGNRSEIMKFDDSQVPTTTRMPVWNGSPPLRRYLSTESGTVVTRGARFIDVVQTGHLPLTGGVEVRWRLFADHDDVEVEVTLRQLADPRPHAYYFALPFQVGKARRLVATAGLAVDPQTEFIPNGCPWWSAQEGFAVGDDTSTVYVAAPDTPMIGFNRLPFGGSCVDDIRLEGPGTSWVWLANNYWETNFKADASGVLRLRFRLGFDAGGPAAGPLFRTGSLARHEMAYHPLPQANGAPPGLKTEGTLLEVLPGPVLFEGCVADPATNAVRVILTNPEKEASEASLRGRDLRLLGAERVDPEGRSLESLPIRQGGVTITVPARSSVFLRLEAAIS